MKDNKITFENGQLVNPGYVEIDGVRHEVTEAEYEGNTPLSAYNLNLMQDNLRENISTNESNLGTDTDTYDNAKTYAVGDITIKDNQLYKCITPVTTAEEFDISKWQKTSLKEMIEVHNVTTAGTDLNDYTENGSWFFPSATVAPTNIPAGTNGWLDVIRHDDKWVKQIWYRAGTANSNDYQTYIRTKTSGTWSNWKQFQMVEDSGWIDIVPVHGTAHTTNYYKPQYRKIGKLIYLKGYITNVTVESTILFTLPSGFYNTGTRRTFLTSNDASISSLLSLVRVMHNGNVLIIKTNGNLENGVTVSLDGIIFTID